MTRQPETCVMIGRCFTIEVAYLLLKSEEFHKDYRIIAFPTVATENFETDLPRLLEVLQSASLIIFQPAIWATWGGDRLYERVLSSLPDNAHRISFPYPVFHTFWPFSFNDTSRVAAAAAEHNATADDDPLLFSYGDANVTKMIRGGMKPDAIVEQYRSMQIPDIIDLDRLLKTIVDDHAYKETSTDVKILDFIMNQYQKQSLFSCVNHGANSLLLYISNQILTKLSYTEISSSILARLGQLVDPAIPIHPSIIRYFNLQWITPEMRYKIDRRRFLTFDEYIYALTR